VFGSRNRRQNVACDDSFFTRSTYYDICKISTFDGNRMFKCSYIERLFPSYLAGLVYMFFCSIGACIVVSIWVDFFCHSHMIQIVRNLSIIPRFVVSVVIGDCNSAPTGFVRSMHLMFLSCRRINSSSVRISYELVAVGHTFPFTAVCSAYDGWV